MICVLLFLRRNVSGFQFVGTSGPLLRRDVYMVGQVKSVLVAKDLTYLDWICRRVSFKMGQDWSISRRCLWLLYLLLYGNPWNGMYETPLHLKGDDLTDCQMSSKCVDIQKQLRETPYPATAAHF